MTQNTSGEEKSKETPEWTKEFKDGYDMGWADCETSLEEHYKSQPYWPGDDEIKEGATRELVEGGWINVFSTRGEMDNFKEIFITAISWLKQRLTESPSK